MAKLKLTSTEIIFERKPIEKFFVFLLSAIALVLILVNLYFYNNSKPTFGNNLIWEMQYCLLLASFVLTLFCPIAYLTRKTSYVFFSIISLCVQGFSALAGTIYSIIVISQNTPEAITLDSVMIYLLLPAVIRGAIAFAVSLLVLSLLKPIFRNLFPSQA